MTGTDPGEPDLGGVLRMTWVTGGLARVLEHSQSDEPSGTALITTVSKNDDERLRQQTRFCLAKPPRWVIASFEHHCDPHGLRIPTSTTSSSPH